MPGISHMPGIVDDKSEHCVPFILSQIQAHQDKYRGLKEVPPPFFLGLNGVQGAGKTTLVSTLCDTLSSPPHCLPVLVLSIDDLYLPHNRQVELADSQSNNTLVQHRGQPSTHDVDLGVELFGAIKARNQNIKIPSYDKSAFEGQGDRVDDSAWHVVNRPDQPPVEVVIFEGWCVGFRPLVNPALEHKWTMATQAATGSPQTYSGQLGKIPLNSVTFVNDALKRYDKLTDQLDALVHIDAEDTTFVYRWRQEQEAALRASKGRGMTVDQVSNFVNGYYPAYELYSDNLRSGIFSQRGRQLRLVVGPDRRVKEVVQL